MGGARSAHVNHDDFGGQANIVDLYVSYLRRKIDAGRVRMIVHLTACA